jgi:predicted HTH domain antitoxin
MKNLTLEFPSFLALSLKMGNEEFLKEVKILAIVKMYELGKISSGTAAKVLGIQRLDFLELLCKYKVSYMDSLTEEELDAELHAI